MKIVVVKRDKLGDMLLTTPLLRALRQQFPKAEIHVLASEYSSWVVRDYAGIDRLWDYPWLRPSSLLRPARIARYFLTFARLRREKFDVAFAAQGEYSPRSIAKALAVQAKRTVAFAPHDHGFGDRLTDVLPPPVNGHEAERILMLGTALGVSVPSDVPLPEFKLPTAAVEFAAPWLHARELDPRRYVVLGLGARHDKKQPTTDQILRWTSWWHATHGLKTVLMWTPGKAKRRLYPGDDEIAEAVLAAGHRAIIPFRGPIMDALGLIWNAATSVFPDSGLMHFAAASPGGVLGLFPGPHGGPGADRWGPRGKNALWLQGNQRVTEIPDQAVFDALSTLLRASVSESA